MRNRKWNRGLVPLVVLVWVMLGYRFWHRVAPPENAQLAQLEVLPSATVSDRVDTFRLSMPFRDPFLREPTGREQRSPQEKSKAGPKVIAKQSFPRITYKGSLQAGKRVGLIIWDGKSYTVSAQQSIKNAQIKRVDPQYIELRIEGRSYRINKGQSIGTG